MNFYEPACKVLLKSLFQRIGNDCAQGWAAIELMDKALFKQFSAAEG